MSQVALTSRRSFLTGLFTEPKKFIGNKSLSRVDSLKGKTDAVLWALAGDRRDNIFVAGDEGTVFHFDGDSWVQEVLGSKLNVHSLCLSGDKVYSVGWLGRICVREDSVWRPIQGGQNTPDVINAPLFDIEAASDGSLWAVGDQGRITQFDGDNWIEHDSGTQANLRSVLPLGDGRILVAGLGGKVLEFSQDQWRSIDTESGCPIVSMASLDDGSVIAVGGEYDLKSSGFVGRVFIYADGEWKRVEIDYPLPRLRRVRREGDNLLVTGDGGVAFRWLADEVTLLPTRLRYDLHDVLSFGDGNTWLCGDNGVVLEEVHSSEADTQETIEEAHQWQQLTSGETNKTLRTLWAVDEDHIIAAGESGTVLHYQNGNVVVRQLPDKPRIHALWGSSPRNVYAVCDSASILHFDGETWSKVHQGSVDTALLAITGFGPHDIFVVGDNGYSLRYDGLMWRQLETGVKQELYGLWGQDSQHLLAVGGGGTVLRWNGDKWKTFSAGTDYDLYGVQGASLNKVVLVGLVGTLIRFEDNAWQRDFSGVRSDLHAVTQDGETFYVAGSNGTILRNSAGIWELEESSVECTLQTLLNVNGTIYAAGSGGVLLKRK